FIYAMNKTKYESLSPAQKQALDAHCTTEWAEKVAGPWADFEAAGRDRMKATPGHEVFKLTDAQLAEWKKTVEPLQHAWADSVKKGGTNPETAMS
ncbi:hypothetical protein, partial [Enterococcus faecalis]|uniref:hypothetical protein n=1 Tax=Enterococcus faecalis TaxID=1351 RepID=UPI00403F2D2D